MTNDNWRESREQEIMDAALAPSGDLESTILTIMEFGAYTAIVRASNDSAGVGLVEAYNLEASAALAASITLNR